MSVSDWKETNDFSSLSYFCAGPIQLPLICEGHETKLGANQMCSHFVSVNFCGLWNKVKIWNKIRCSLNVHSVCLSHNLSQLIGLVLQREGLWKKTNPSEQGLQFVQTSFLHCFRAKTKDPLLRNTPHQITFVHWCLKIKTFCGMLFGGEYKVWITNTLMI